MKDGFLVDGERKEAGFIFESDDPNLFFYFTASDLLRPVDDVELRGTKFKGVGKNPELPEEPEEEVKTEVPKPKGRPKKNND